MSFPRPKPAYEQMICMTAPSWRKKGICGVVPDIDAGSVLTQPWTLRDTVRNYIPEDNYAERPFYFGGSNVWAYDPLANDRVVTYGLKGGTMRAKKCRKTLVKGCR